MGVNLVIVAHIFIMKLMTRRIWLTQLKVTESRILTLEQLLEVKEDESKLLNEKMNHLETSFTKLETEMAGIGKAVEKAFENAVVSLVQ